MGIAVMLGSVNMLGGFIFGYNTGIIAGASKLINETSSEFRMDTNQQGIVTSSILIGALVGSIIGGPLADKFGRKAGVIVLSIISVVLAPLLAIAINLKYLIVIRTFLGLGVGMTGIICPMYVAENAPPERRGPLGILFQLAITIGIFIAYCVNAALQNVHHGWRIMFGLGAIPAVALLVLGFVIPESFVWQAKRSGAAEHSSLLRVNENPRPLRARIWMFLRSRALFIGLVLAVAQQLTGINAFMFYAPTIFSTAGISNSIVPTIGLGAWNVVSTIIAIPLVNRYGRRPLLIVGTSIMTVACIALGLSYKYANGTMLSVLTIALLLVFVLAFEIGDGPLFWMVAHELFTPEIKTVGASTLNAAQWIFNILLSFGFPSFQDKLHEYVFFIFGILGAICTGLLILFLPETRNSTKSTTTA